MHQSIFTLFLISLFILSCAPASDLSQQNLSQTHQSTSELVSSLSESSKKVPLSPEQVSNTDWILIGTKEGKEIIEVPNTDFTLSFGAVEELPWPCDEGRACIEIVAPMTEAQLKTACQNVSLLSTFMEVFGNESADSYYQQISFDQKKQLAENCKTPGDQKAKKFITTAEDDQAAAYVWDKYLYIETAHATWVFKRI